MTWAELVALYGLGNRRPPASNLEPAYNRAPTQRPPVVRLDANSDREGVIMRWGLIPSWAKDHLIGSKYINARGDGVASKPALRSANKARRCPVPVSGFYEWKAAKPPKQPYYITAADGGILTFAGLWETWRGSEQVPGQVETFTINTTEPKTEIAALQDRMPGILGQMDWDTWLDPASRADQARTGRHAADAKGKPDKPASVQKDLASNLGGHLHEVTATIRKLTTNTDKADLLQKAFLLYEVFWPEVAAGAAGRGAKGELRLDAIEDPVWPPAAKSK